MGSKTKYESQRTSQVYERVLRNKFGQAQEISDLDRMSRKLAADGLDLDRLIDYDSMREEGVNNATRGRIFNYFTSWRAEINFGRKVTTYRHLFQVILEGKLRKQQIALGRKSVLAIWKHLRTKFPN